MDIFLEAGQKKVFAVAVDWPGWGRQAMPDCMSQTAVEGWDSLAQHTELFVGIAGHTLWFVGALLFPVLNGIAAGDRVFGAPGFGLGCYAEYICLPEAGGDGVVAAMPASMSHEEAAAVPFGAMEALHFLKRAHIRPGEQVLVNGAGGSIGTFGVQLAKHYGAEVTAVDSEGKLGMLRSIGPIHWSRQRRLTGTSRPGRSWGI